MKFLQVSVDQRVIASRVLLADTQDLRRKGLSGKKRLGRNEGALLDMSRRPGLSFLHLVHMVGIPFPMTLVWLDIEGRPVEARLANSGRIYYPSGVFTTSKYVLETHIQHLELITRAKKVSWESSELIQERFPTQEK